MSIEFSSSTPEIRRLAGDAGHLAGDAMRATGASPSAAYGLGANAGGMAVEILLGALAEEELLELAGTEIDLIRSAMDRIVARANIPEALARLRADEATR